VARAPSPASLIQEFAESFDHVLQSDESFAEKCEYIRQNAVDARALAREAYPRICLSVTDISL